jgi:outer membrane phospholipase A
MEYGEIELGYHWKDFAVALMLRDNLRLENNYGALELNVCFPLVNSIDGYFQYFVGYSDYQHERGDYKDNRERVSHDGFPPCPEYPFSSRKGILQFLSA